MTLQISTVLRPVGPATALELTDAQVAELGGGRRAAVRVTIGDPHENDAFLKFALQA